MEVVSFAVDPQRNTPVVVLKEASGERTLSVPVGPVEASAIAIRSLDITPDKPMTIDLVKLVMERLGGTLERVVVFGFVQGAFQTRLQIVAGNAVHAIACTTSDALALAIRSGAPVFAADDVLEVSQPGDKPSPAEALRRAIASTDTLEFGSHFLE
jgi:bifunctional DNase/RNase